MQRCAINSCLHHFHGDFRFLIEFLFFFLHSLNKTAITYYEAAVQYGATDVKKNAFQWLLINLLSFYSKHGKWLQMLNADLLTELIDSPDLVVMQTEFALYALLKVWVYLKIQQFSNGDDRKIEENNMNQNNYNNLSPSIRCSNGNKTNTNNGNSSGNGATNSSEIVTQASNYFSSLKSQTPFLQTRCGQRFVKPFLKLRMQHLINHPVDIKLILEDNIIPKDWLYLPFMVQWNSLIKIDNCLDSGWVALHSKQTCSSLIQNFCHFAGSPVDCDEKTFYQTCLRCGRVLDDDGYQKWRWTGFNFGVDLVLVSDTRTLSIKRHHRTENERLLSLQSKRNVMLR